MAKYSIILPVRNGGHYLKECINSFLVQTFGDFNCIVLDNCSTDGGAEWVASINDERITVIKATKPLTIEENWARIRQVDKNEFMTMIGHDDILAPHYLAEMNSLIEKHPRASLYQTHYRYIDKDGKTTRICLPMDEIQQSHEFLACQMNETINSTGTGYMMRSSDFNELGGMPTQYPNLIFADFHLWIKLSAKNYKATSLRECFYYREHLSVSRITNGEVYQRAFEEYVNFIAALKTSSTDFTTVVDRYGHRFLLSFCESLSHRLLKTPDTHRTTSVKELISKFRSYAHRLIPDTPFEPLTVPRIRYAYHLDQNRFSRGLFRTLRKLMP